MNRAGWDSLPVLTLSGDVELCIQGSLVTLGILTAVSNSLNTSLPMSLKYNQVGMVDVGPRRTVLRLPIYLSAVPHFTTDLVGHADSFCLEPLAEFFYDSINPHTTWNLGLPLPCRLGMYLPVHTLCTFCVLKFFPMELLAAGFWLCSICVCMFVAYPSLKSGE